MTATAVSAPPELTRAQVRDLIAQAAAARDEGMALAELGEDARRGWNRDLIDRAIGWWAQTGEVFSANSFRDLLPPGTPVQGLMGARFTVAWKAGLIVPIADERSTKRNTHCKPIYRWIGAEFAADRARLDGVSA